MSPRYVLHNRFSLEINSFFSGQFNVPRFNAYRAICDVLERDGRIQDAIACFRQMQRELMVDVNDDGERTQWKLGKWSHEQVPKFV